MSVHHSYFFQQHYKDHASSHPKYSETWALFYKQRKSELAAKGIDIAKYELTKEWKIHWYAQVDSLMDVQYNIEKQKLFLKHDITDTKPTNEKVVVEKEIKEKIEPEKSVQKTSVLSKNIMNFLIKAGNNKPYAAEENVKSAAPLTRSVVSTLKLLNELHKYLGDIEASVNSLLFNAVKLNINKEDPITIFKDITKLEILDSAKHKVIEALKIPVSNQSHDLVSSGSVCLESVSWLLGNIYEKLYFGVNVMECAADPASIDSIGLKVAVRLSTRKEGKVGEHDFEQIMQAIRVVRKLRPNITAVPSSEIQLGSGLALTKPQQLGFNPSTHGQINRPPPQIQQPPPQIQQVLPQIRQPPPQIQQASPLHNPPPQSYQLYNLPPPPSNQAPFYGRPSQYNQPPRDYNHQPAPFNQPPMRHQPPQYPFQQAPPRYHKGF